MSTREPPGETLPACSSELLEMLLDVMPDAAVVVDSAGEIVAVNRLAESLFDYRGEDLAGQRIEMLVPERFRHVHRAHRSAYSATPRPRAMGAGLNLAGRRRDGSEFPVDVSLAPIGGPDRTMVVAAIRDRTEQDRAVADLAQLAAIISSSNDAIFSVTPDGKVATWNPGASHLFGYEPTEMIGQHVSRVFPDNGSPEFEELLAGVATEHKNAPKDAVWVARSGRQIDVAISLSPLTEREGTLLGISVMARDITERKQAEAALRRREWVQATTADIRLSMLSNNPLEKTFALICDRVGELLDAQGTLIGVLGEGDLTVAASGVFAQNTGLLLHETPPLIKEVLESGASRVVPL
jgi:PAS domain S-box-containing protein